MQSIEEIANNYADNMHALWGEFSTEEVIKAAKLIEKTIDNFGTIYTCGNGGSSAIADHLVIDFQKGRGDKRQRYVRVISLCHYVTTTAVANDIGYEYNFSFPLESLARPGDILIAFSVSGNSSNILYAVEKAKELHMPIIGMTGFDGGGLGLAADINLNIPVTNYGMAEDFFQPMMHIIAQYLHQE